MPPSSLSRDELRHLYISDLNLSSLLDFALIHATRYDDDELGSALATVVSLVRPENSLARLVCAYYAWEGLELDRFDDQLLAMESLVNSGSDVGAAAIMIDRFVDRTNEYAEDLRIGAQTHDLSALRQSIAAEPTWVENYSRLASALVLEGDIAEASEQLDAALANTWGPAELDRMTLPEASFHVAFTGKFSSRAELHRRREALDG